MMEDPDSRQLWTRAYSVDDIPETVAAEFDAALEAILAGDDALPHQALRICDG